MPAHPRHHVVREGAIGVYHVWSRCVQRAFLCGFDPCTGRNFDYRRDWIERLLEFQAGVFGVDLFNFNILTNHEHLICRTRPDVVAKWTDEDVVWRWKLAWPTWKESLSRWEATPSDQAIRELLKQPEKVVQIRKNLSSLSWFIARCKEPIARLANREMNRSGHYWEQRFGARELCGDSAVLGCSVYVDLNQWKAGMVESLEESNYSAIQMRIRMWQEVSGSSEYQEQQRQWREAQIAASLEAFQSGKPRPDQRLTHEDLDALYPRAAWLAPLTAGGPPILIGDSGLDYAPYAPAVFPQTSEPLSLVLAEQAGPTPERNEVPLSSTAAEPPTDQPVVGQEIEVSDENVTLPSGEAGDSNAEAAGHDAVSDQARGEASAEGGPTASDALKAGRSSMPESGTPGAERKWSKQSQVEQFTYEIHRRLVQRQRKRASDNTLLPMPLGQYVELVEKSAAYWSAEHTPLPPELNEVLARMGIVPERWSLVLEGFERLFSQAVGNESALAEFLQRVGQRTVRGIRRCRSAFT